MIRLLKSIAVSLLACAPFLIGKLLQNDPKMLTASIAAYAVVVGFVNYFGIFQPDKRFLAIRDPTLDNIFQTVLEVSPEVSWPPASGERSVFRIHIFRARGWGPLQWLEPVYSYQADQHDPDRGVRFWKLPWQSGQGLVWRVANSGSIGLFTKGAADVKSVKKEFSLSKKQARITGEVAGILAFPLRSDGIASDMAIPYRVKAVLCIDTLDRDYVHELENICAGIKQGKCRDWVELVDRVSMYF